jgi:lysophospholipase L1-like esterase
MQIRLVSVMFALCVGVWGTEGLADAPAPSNVVLIGDSITAGYGASGAMTAYSSDLGSLLGSPSRVQAFGHSGATMIPTSTAPFVPYIKQPEYTGATDAVAALGASTDLAVVIMLGTNDSDAQNWRVGGGTSAEAYRAAYAAMVDHFVSLAPRARIYAALPPTIFVPGMDTTRDCVLYNEVMPVIREVAKQKNLTIIDVYGATSGHPEYFTTSSGLLDIHPNDAGHRAIAQVMYRTLLGQADGGTRTDGVCGAGVFPKPDGGSLPADADASQPPADADASPPPADGDASQPPADGDASQPKPDNHGGAGGAAGAGERAPLPSSGGCAVAPGSSRPLAWSLWGLALLAGLGARSRYARRWIRRASRAT